MLRTHAGTHADADTSSEVIVVSDGDDDLGHHNTFAIKQRCTAENKWTRARCTRRFIPSHLHPPACHQHRSHYQRQQPQTYADWIDPSLSRHTRHKLDTELFKPLSDKDKPGFIYVYQLVDSTTSPQRHLDSSLYKIGRTTNIHRRLTEWSTRCGYTPRLVEYFSSSTSTPNNTPPVPIKYSHRCERLIHIDLSDAFGCGPMICPGKCREAHYEWFRAHVQNSETPMSTSTLKTSHQDSVMSGWSRIRRIILKWISFVETEYGTVPPPITLEPIVIDDITTPPNRLLLPISSMESDIIRPTILCEETTHTDPLDALSSALSCLCLKDKAYRVPTVREDPPHPRATSACSSVLTDDDWYDAQSTLSISGGTEDTGLSLASNQHLFYNDTESDSDALEMWEDLIPKQKRLIPLAVENAGATQRREQPH
ncbi:meiotically up-regulated gene 113-domain-containing protein [Gaertneriomyces semiglobifer]|nr:meiotically up-regulated gene 113-domain-containing protein [Gaertneriomyces semiglobifer]